MRSVLPAGYHWLGKAITIVVLAGLGGTGCRREPPADSADHPTRAEATASSLAPVPTAGAAALSGNVGVAAGSDAPVIIPTVDSGADDFLSLSSRIDDARARLDKRATDQLTRQRLISLLLARAQIAGNPVDHRELRGLSNAWLALSPTDPHAHLAAAEVNARQHLFAAADHSLDRAHALGANPSATSRVRASLALARGEIDAVLPKARAAAAKTPSATTLGDLAVAELEAGSYDQAITTLHAALGAINDVAPFPVAWLCFQIGRAHELRGAFAVARDAFAKAVEIYPAYSDARTHMIDAIAATGDRRAAAVLAAALAHDTGLADHLALCANLCGELDPDLAVRSAAAARSAYDELLTDLGPAYGDHAARFFLGAGADPSRALALALDNLSRRRSTSAIELALEAALLAQEQTKACGLATDHVTVASQRRLQFLAWRAYTACGDPSRAATLGKSLGLDGAQAR